MRRLAASALAAIPFWVLVATPASALCTTNPAICQAICGCDCCTTQSNCGPIGFRMIGSGDVPQALRGFTTEQLERELETLRNDPEVADMIRLELARRYDEASNERGDDGRGDDGREGDDPEDDGRGDDDGRNGVVRDVPVPQ